VRDSEIARLQCDIRTDAGHTKHIAIPAVGFAVALHQKQAVSMTRISPAAGGKACCRHHSSGKIGRLLGFCNDDQSDYQSGIEKLPSKIFHGVFLVFRQCGPVAGR